MLCVKLCKLIKTYRRYYLWQYKFVKLFIEYYLRLNIYYEVQQYGKPVYY